MDEPPVSSPPPAPPPPPTPVMNFPPPTSGYGQGSVGYPAGPVKPAWPMVIGIICVVFAGLGLICLPISIVVEKFNPAESGIYKLFPEWYSTFSTVISICGAATSTILLIGGILLLKRFRSAKTALILYSAVSMAIAGVNYAVMLGANLGGKLSDAERLGWYIGLLIGLPLSLAGPLFLIIWFTRAKIKADMADWR